MIPRQQQGVLGSGQRDVEQPAFLVDAALRQLLAVGVDDVLEGLAVTDRGGVEHRYPVATQPGLIAGAIAAQQGRKLAWIVEPGARLAGGRENPGR